MPGSGPTPPKPSKILSLVQSGAPFALVRHDPIDAGWLQVGEGFFGLSVGRDGWTVAGTPCAILTANAYEGLRRAKQLSGNLLEVDGAKMMLAERGIRDGRDTLWVAELVFVNAPSSGA